MTARSSEGRATKSSTNECSFLHDPAIQCGQLFLIVCTHLVLARTIEVRTASEFAKLQGARTPNNPTGSPNVVLQDATPHLHSYGAGNYQERGILML